MDLFFVILFLVIYYIRPQDWVPGLIGYSIVKPIILLGLFSLLNRERTLSPEDFFKTPLDWAMLFYTVYIILTTPSGLIATAKGFAPLPVFYWLTVLALDREEKMLRYMKWWTAMLIILAAFGIAQLYGIDLTGGQPQTDFFKGRLSLGTWTHNNPNALAHSVVVAIPLVFFLMFWKSTFVRRIISALLILLAFYASVETKSKGAFVVGGGAIVLALVFGRKKIVQILIISAAFAGGGTLLAMMPRMEEMNSLGSDEGVIGRMLAWEIARTSSINNTYGEGWKVFRAYVEYEGGVYPKACHSTYVRIGADLGYPGMFFFLLIIWCCFRILISVKTNNLDFERCRRMLFLLLATYIVSGWMIDRSYHTEYFLIAACCAAMHRLQLAQGREIQAPESPEIALSNNGNSTSNPDRTINVIYDEPDLQPGEVEPKNKLQKWTHLGIVDLFAAYVIMRIAFEVWDYIMGNI